MYPETAINYAEHYLSLAEKQGLIPPRQLFATIGNGYAILAQALIALRNESGA